MKLTNNQQIATDEINNNLQIIACAGSGKTEVIVRRIVKILKQDGIFPSNVIAFTFTEKAAASMKLRVSKALELENIDKGDISKMYIGTIHGFCSNILTEYSKKFADFKILDSALNYLFLKKNFNKLNTNILDLKKSFHDIKLFETCIEKLIDDYKNIDSWEENIKTLFDNVQKSYFNDKFLSFSLLIKEAINEIENNKAVRERLREVKYLVVDEYQDIDDMQEHLVSLFYDNGTNVCIVGDDDQTIYQFRGSNAENMINFSQKYKNVTQVKLEENFRSTTHIVKLADHIIRKNTLRLNKCMFSLNNSKSIVKTGVFENMHEETAEIINQIKLLGELGVPYSEIAILSRKNKDIKYICDELSKIGVPFNATNNETFFEEIYFEKFCEIFKMCSEEIDRKRFRLCFEDIVDSTSIKNGYNYLKNSAENNMCRIFENVLEELNFFQEDTIARQVAANNFKQILEDFDFIYKDNQLSYKLSEFSYFVGYELENGYNYYNFDGLHNNTEDAVNIMTIHKSKGLEFNSVFIVGLEHGSFPSKNIGGKKYWSILGEYFRQNKHKYDSSVDDERKLFYVAITRAKENLYLYTQSSKKNPSDFFKDAANFEYALQ